MPPDSYGFGKKTQYSVRPRLAHIKYFLKTFELLQATYIQLCLARQENASVPVPEVVQNRRPHGDIPFTQKARHLVNDTWPKLLSGSGIGL